MNDLTTVPTQQPPAPMTAASRQLQQREMAETQAKLYLAQQFPRDQIAVQDAIVNAFTRLSLAEVSTYQYSRGGTDIEGPSIRAAEAMAQLYQNFEFGFREIARGIGPDGVPFSEVEAYAWDLQNRVRRPLQFIVRHWRDTKKGGYMLKDERDIYELMANMAQRRVRACILSAIPGDIVEAAMQQAAMTLHTKIDVSPEATKRMLEAFSAYGITREQIEHRIQRRIDAIQPAQIVNLKKIYASLKDGMSVVADWFDPIEQQDAAAPQKSAEAVKDKLRARKAAEPAKPDEPAQPDSAEA